jgi:hypothetical protein
MVVYGGGKYRILNTFQISKFLSQMMFLLSSSTLAPILSGQGMLVMMPQKASFQRHMDIEKMRFYLVEMVANLQ